MIRRAFLRRLGLGAAAVVVSPLDAFELPELAPWRFTPTATSLLEDLAIVQCDLNSLNSLMHEVYCDAVVSSVREASAITKLFGDMQRDTAEHYALHGERLTFAVDLRYNPA